jgi:hypothetical protein
MGFDSMINRIPQKISGRVANSYSTYTPQDNIYQWALGGQPLLSAASQERPDVEKLVEQRKNQFDSYKDPGEYSLSQWWLRSQHEFNGGAGIVYQDPDTQNTYLLAKNTRYDTSLGVDPFTDYSKLQMLSEVNKSTNFSTATDAGGFTFRMYVQSYQSSTGADAVFAARGHTVYNLAIGPADVTVTNSTVLTNDASQYGITGGIGYTGSGSAGGNTAYVYQDQSTFGGANSGVFSVTEAGVATRIYLDDGTHNTKVISVCKNDLILTSGNKLYQLNPAASANTALPSPAAAIPIGQNIVSVTSGPDAVYVAANDGAMGYIYKTQYSSTTPGLIVALSQVAVLPEGEQLNTIAFYVGTYLALATDMGGRIANVTDAGVIYGPLIFTFPKTVGQTNGCKGIAFFGSLCVMGVYSSVAQHDGAWGTMCIDLGTVNADSVTGFSTNAYARWLYSASMNSPIHDLTMSQSGRLVISALPVGTANSSLWLEHATNVTPNGYLTTGRCRFNTIEPKLFKFFSVRSPYPFNGTLEVSVLDEGGGETSYITYTNAITPGTNDVATPTPSGPQNWIKLKFYFTRSATDTTSGAVMNGWQIKALPGLTRQRMISKWFNCFNYQQDMEGARVGSDTYALTTLNAVRTMAQRQDVVILQDLVNGVNELVVVDDYNFVQTAPPGPNAENYGGFLQINMRTVADVVPPLPPTTGTPVD